MQVAGLAGAAVAVATAVLAAAYLRRTGISSQEEPVSPASEPAADATSVMTRKEQLVREHQGIQRFAVDDLGKARKFYEGTLGR